MPQIALLPANSRGGEDWFTKEVQQQGKYKHSPTCKSLEHNLRLIGGKFCGIEIIADISLISALAILLLPPISRSLLD